MRNVNKVINKTVTEVKEIEIDSEKIISITENKEVEIITLEIAQYSLGVLMGKYTVTIKNEDYDLLMSENPFFSPNKPKNEYREIDLWYMVDSICN